MTTPHDAEARAADRIDTIAHIAAIQGWPTALALAAAAGWAESPPALAPVGYTFPVLVEVDPGAWVSLDQVTAITQTDRGALVFLVGGMQIATSKSATEVVALLRAAVEVAP